MLQAASTCPKKHGVSSHEPAKQATATGLTAATIGLLLQHNQWGLMMFGIGKWKTEEWEGEVVDKKELTTTDNEGYDLTFYYLFVKLSDGKVERKRYDDKTWALFNVGDKIVKRPGEKKPVKG